MVWYAPLTHFTSPAFDVLFPPVTTGADARFCIRGIGRERVADLRIDGPAITSQAIHGSSDFLNTSPCHCIPTNYHALADISSKSGDESITCDVQLVSGRSLKGKVLDPDGKPLNGVRVAGLKDMGYWLNTDAEFTVESLHPNKSRLLQFVHDDRKLSGFLVLRGDEKDPISVRLQLWGTLTGRLITHQGEPLAGMNVNCGGLSTQTGKDGRFRIEGLAVGRKYDLLITKDAYVRNIVGGGPKDLTIKAGETKELGDLQVKPREQSWP